MAISLVATPQTSPAGVPRVRLDVTWTTAPVPTSVTLARVESAGGTVTVRQGDPLNLGAGVGTAYDYEAPFEQPVTYTATTTTAATTSSASVTLSSAGVPWLVHAGMPELSVPLSLVTQWPEWSRAVPQGVFVILGRAAPIVTTGRRQAERGTLTVVTQSEVEAQQMQRILADGTVLLLKGSSTDYLLNRWVAVGDVTESPFQASSLRELVGWTLPLQVVDAPAGQALAAATYADAAATFTSYADALAKALTYAARTAGAWKVG